MLFAVSTLIKAARVYKDDDHDDEDAWLDDSDWLRLFNVEYAQLYPRWVKAGLVVPKYTDALLSATTTALTGVMAIAGVAKLEDGRYTPLEHLQPRLGRSPWLTSNTGPGKGWVSYGSGDNLTIEVSPPPNDLTFTGAVYATVDMGMAGFFLSYNIGSNLPTVRAPLAGAAGNGIQIRMYSLTFDTLPTGVPNTVGVYAVGGDTKNIAIVVCTDAGNPSGTPVTTVPQMEALIDASGYLVVTADHQNRASWSGTPNAFDIAGYAIHSSAPNAVATTAGGIDAIGNFYVRYYAVPAYLTAITDTVELPYGADERLVLGMADRAGIKDSTVSRNIKEMKADADAQLAFLASGRGDGPRVRRLVRAPHNDRFAAPFTTDPRLWYYCY